MLDAFRTVAVAQRIASRAACSWSLFDPCAQDLRQRPAIRDDGISGRFDISALDPVRCVSSRAMPSARDSCADRPRRAAARARSSRVTTSRLRIASPTTSLKVRSAATAMIASRARGRAALSGRRRGIEQHAQAGLVQKLRFCCVSSSTSKRAATLASNGNWCRSRVQKAWMVCTFSPPGVSSASGEQPARPRPPRRDPARRSRSPDRLVELRRRRASSSAASSSNTRFAILAAAALVKVMQRIFAGSTPSSSSRITRCASTWVLPEPALAATQADSRRVGRRRSAAAARRPG